MTAINSKKLFWIIAFGAVLVYFGSIWHRPLFAPDEIRYAQIPKEMIGSGNYAVATLNNLSYYEKPVLGYWFTAASMKIFGETPFAVRFPSAFFTLLTALVVYRLGIRADSPGTGAAGALLFLCSGLVFAVGTFAVLDAPFSFFVTAATALAYFYYTEKTLSRKLLYLFLAGLSLGAGIMIKGLLAPLLAGLAVTGFFFWKKEFRKWAFAILPVLLGMIITALPPALLTHKHAPDFWKEFILIEHFSRGLTGEGAGDNRSQPFWFYIPVLIATLLPVLLFIIPGLWTVRKKCKAFFLQNDFNLFCSITIVLWFLFFSAASGKLVTYILPLFPFISLLLARRLREMAAENQFSLFNRIVQLFCGIIGAGVILFIIWHILPCVPWKLKLYSGMELFPAVVAVCMLLLWYMMAAREKDIYPERKFLYFCLGTAAAMLLAHHVIPRKIVSYHDQKSFIRRAVIPRLRPGALILADGRIAAGAAWTLGHPVRVYIKPGELNPGLRRAGLKAVTPEDLKKMLPEAGKKGQQIVVIVSSPSRLKDMPVQTGKTVTRSGKMSAIFYGDNTK